LIWAGAKNESLLQAGTPDVGKIENIAGTPYGTFCTCNLVGGFADQAELEESLLEDQGADSYDRNCPYD
jgi:hypothetical protein